MRSQEGGLAPAKTARYSTRDKHFVARSAGSLLCIAAYTINATHSPS